MPTRFASGSWHAMKTGAPTLAGAAIVFDCAISAVSEVGTHSVFFCEVEAIRTGSIHDGLIYFGRSYHRIGHGTAGTPLIP